MYDYLFFDLDGTLTDPAEGITNSFKNAFTEMGMEIPAYETLLSFIGPPLPVTFGEILGLPKEKVDEAIKKYREYFSVKGLFENKVYPGIPQLLGNLKKAGKKLVVATSKPEEYSVRIIEKFGLAEYFENVCGSSMDETRGSKAEIIAYAMKRNKISDKSKILMIGDRHHDIDGAKANGLKSCGVLVGYGSREELEKAGADYIISDFSELYDII